MLNIIKAKETEIDIPSGVFHPNPLNTNDQNIESVHSYKYVFTAIDDTFTWNAKHNEFI